MLKYSTIILIFVYIFINLTITFMKKLFYSFFHRSKWFVPMWMCVTFITACDDDDSTQLALSSPNAVFSVEGGKEVLGVFSSTFWKAESQAPDWCKVKTDATTLTITATPNIATDIRTTTITVTSEGSNAMIKVFQEPADTTTLSVIVPDHYTFDSEGGNLTATVITNRDWMVSTNQEWCTAVSNPSARTFTISVPPNKGETERSSTVTVMAGPEENRSVQTFILTQDIRANNPYYAIVGSWNLYSDEWYYDGNTTGAGTHYSCSIEALVYNETLNIKDFIIEGTSLEITYNKEVTSVNIPIGWLIGNKGSVYYYLCAVNIPERKFSTGEIKGILSEDLKTIRITELPEGYDGLGIIGYTNMQYVMFSDLYYAAGSTIELQKTSPNNALQKPMSSVSFLVGISPRLPQDIKGKIDCIIKSAQ